jgi:xanthine dehydrogenase YagR molybdenum-binding subunit
MTAASVTPAVQDAASQVRDKLIAIAIADPGSRLHGADKNSIDSADGWLHSKTGANKREPFAAIIARAGGTPVEALGEGRASDETKKEYATHSFGAVFAEVEVDEPLAQIRVRRIVAAYSVGRILNAKTARSQLIGGIVWGIGMGLLEHTQVDPNTGRVANANLAQYHVPVNADVADIDVTFVDEDDRIFNPVGARGIGEIGITGVPAAIGNAVFHATGKRIRSLPITPDNLLAV